MSFYRCGSPTSSGGNITVVQYANSNTVTTSASKTCMFSSKNTKGNTVLLAVLHQNTLTEIPTGFTLVAEASYSTQIYLSVYKKVFDADSSSQTPSYVFRQSNGLIWVGGYEFKNANIIDSKARTFSSLTSALIINDFENKPCILVTGLLTPSDENDPWVFYTYGDQWCQKKAANATVRSYISEWFNFGTACINGYQPKHANSTGQKAVGVLVYLTDE